MMKLLGTLFVAAVSGLTLRGPQKNAPCLLQQTPQVVGKGSPIPSGDSYGPWTSKNFSKEAIKNTPCAKDGKSSIFDDASSKKRIEDMVKANSSNNSLLLQKRQPCLLQQPKVVGSGSPIPSGDSYGPWTSKNFSKEAIKNTPCAKDGKSSIFEDASNTKKKGSVVPAGAPGPAPAPSMLLQKKDPCFL